VLRRPFYAIIGLSVYRLEIAMKKYMHILFTLMIAAIVVSCVSSSDDSQSNEQRQGAGVDSGTPSPFPDLESVLIRESDLPDGYSAGSVSSSVPTYYDKILVPDADYVIRQQFQKNDSSAGQVIVFYYLEQGTISFAFDSIVSDMRQSKALEGLGEKAEVKIALGSSMSSQNSTGIVFVQCHVVVHISLLGTDDEQAGIFYAERLSMRLDAFVCD